MFRFWHRWLLTVYVAFVVFGLAFAIFGTSAAMSPYVGPVLDSVWPGGIPSEAQNFAVLAFGIAGALTAALGELGYFVTRFAIAKRESWAWNGLLASLVLWFVVDSAMSVYAGAAINAAFNTVFFLLALIPLIGIRRHLEPGREQARRTSPAV